MNFRRDQIVRLYARAPEEVRARVEAVIGLEIIEPSEMVSMTQTRRRGEQQLYQIGERYRILSDHDDAVVGTLLITNARRQRLDDASDADCRAEGFASRRAFITYWQALFGTADLDELVWVYDFLVDEQLSLYPLDSSIQPEFPGLSIGV